MKHVTEPPRPRRSLLEELKTRRVYRVAALYVVVVFALLQGADLVLPAFDAPDWVFRVLVMIGVAGFFVAVALGWIFDLTPGGLERTDSGRMLSGPAARLMQRGLVAAVAVAAAGAAGVTAWRSVRPATPVEQNRIMVFPLVVSGASTLSPAVGEDVATMIGHALDGTGPLRWIDGWPLLDVEAREDVRRLTLDAARRLAAERECGYFLTGRVVLRNDSAQVLLELRSTATGEEVVKGEASGGAQDPWRVGVRAVTDVVRHLIPTRVPNLEARFEDRPPAAVARFLLGEQSYRRASFHEAFDHFAAAFDADSTFAIAAIRGAQAASWEHDVGAAQRLIDAALLLELPPRERAFTEGIRAYLDGDAEGAIEALGRSLEQDSLMGVAWAQLGEVYRHLAPVEAPPYDAAQDAFERALVLDQSAAYVLYHLLESVIRSGDDARATDLLAQFRALDPDPDLEAQVSYMYECVSTGAAALPTERLAQWARERPLDLLVAAGQLSAQGRQLPCAEAMFLAIIVADTARDAAWQGRYWGAYLGLGSSLLARNAMSDGERYFTTAVRSYPEFHTLMQRTVPTATGVRLPQPHGELPPPQDVESGRNPLGRALPVLLLAGVVHPELAAVAAQASRHWAGGTDMMAATNSTLVWLYGLLSARDGRFEDATRARTRLVTLGEEREDDAVRQLIVSLDAHVALIRGDTVTGLRQLEGLRPHANRSDITWGILSSLGVERITVAELLLRRGEAEQALARAAAFDASGPFIHSLFTSRSLAIRREAAAALGSRALAGQFETRLRALDRSAEGPS